MIELLIASVPDKEKVVAELWVENYQLAEVYNENEELQINIFSYPEVSWKGLSLTEFLSRLNEAHKKLSY